MPEQANKLRGTRILVVEDEFLIADDLAIELRRCGAEPVGPVGSVAGAKRLIQEERLDGAILDLNLRGEAAAGLAQELAKSKVPFLIVSGYSEQSFPDEFRNFPSLEKPVDYRRVTDKLATILAEAPSQAVLPT